MIRSILLMFLRFYRVAISPWFGNVCRFEPSCSRYAIACIEGHGAARGSWLSFRRLCRCHPFHPGGYDPPPPIPLREHPAPDARTATAGP